MEKQTQQHQRQSPTTTGSSGERMPVQRKETGDWLSPIAELFEPLRMMERFFGRPSSLFSGFDRFLPNMDIEERDGEYLVCIDLPGVPKENVKIEVDGNLLTVLAERRSSEEERGRGTRYYGSFQRSFTLPQGTNPDQIRADYKDGELILHVPRLGESSARRIEISGGSGQMEKASSTTPRH